MKIVNKLLLAMMISAAVPVFAADDATAPLFAIQEENKLTVQITAIDAAKRKLTVQLPSGELADVDVGAEVRNFDRLKVGDKVTTQISAAIAYEVVKGAAGVRGTTESTDTSRSEPGQRPGGGWVKTETLTADVVAVNRKTSQIKVKTPDNKIVEANVKNPAALEQIAVGDQISIILRRSIAIWVEQPAK
ncbi:hypothetical protein [Jeongeupia chitinilytica]|uniref:DUF5666 domain-containing protein n=1 Tax=Jeongeupia chitinilytica TaxID=1041641 RepID=A0ABQ3GZQ4_9NEIS|nr:hypothetical protein [Jeongeupia chitinilytica]GHD60242.1 hypothetical protein GCM10007350_12940 [Jeongeupia chitinilytica]